MNKLPVYEMVINPDPNSDVEVSYVAFVDKPAIERNFLAFKDQKMTFAINDEKRIVSGPAMVADSLIYRKDDQGEYNVFFTADTISQIALKFFKKDFQKNLNLFHDPSLSLEGVTIFESFVTDASRGIQPMKGFEDLPDGTWFISAKVENDAVWQAIKEGKVRGFSVEGIFSYVKKEKPLIGTDKQNRYLLETSFMSEIKNELKDLVQTLKQKFFGPVIPPVAPVAPPAPAELAKDYTTKAGQALNIDKLEVGGVVMMNGAPAPDGEYELQDGTKCTVAGGAITAVTPAMAAAAPVVAPAAQAASTLTPEQQMAALKEAIGKFAVGTPDERVMNLETVSKALMDYCFGYEIRRTQEDAVKNQAIEIYKTTLGQYKTQLEEAGLKLKAQGETIKGIFEIIEKIAASPSGNPAGGNKNNFVTQKINDRDENLRKLSANLQKLKTA